MTPQRDDNKSMKSYIARLEVVGLAIENALEHDITKLYEVFAQQLDDTKTAVWAALDAAEEMRSRLGIVEKEWERD